MIYLGILEDEDELLYPNVIKVEANNEDEAILKIENYLKNNELLLDECEANYVLRYIQLESNIKIIR